MMKRRDFLALAPAALLAQGARAFEGRPLRVAAVVTEFSHRSHAHVILENFLGPYLFNGQKTDSGSRLVSLYVDQFPKNDMARAVAKEHEFPIVPTIADALTVGGEGLGVDAVLLIAEQGDHPVNKKGQQEYPRKRFFDETIAVLRNEGRTVPVFCDKHLSYRWDWAKAMVDESKALGVPLMAGSSVPLAQRLPALELPDGAKVLEGVAVHGGPLERYDFHGLEVLQSLLESRQGGETGVASVDYLEGDALLAAGVGGRWDMELARAALATELGPNLPALPEWLKGQGTRPRGVLLAYKDGTKGASLALGGQGSRFAFAGRLAGEEAPRACRFYGGPWNNRCLFKAFAHAIQVFFREGSAPFPVERTLLTTGALAFAMESRAQGRLLETPKLAIAYAPKDFRRVRETGATWKVLTEDRKEPKGLDDSGR